MSSRRSRSRKNRGGSSKRLSDDEIKDLVSNLQQLLPQIRNIHSDRKVSSGRVLQETCNYIRSLQKQVDDLTERLSQILENADTAHSATIRSLLMH